MYQIKKAILPMVLLRIAVASMMLIHGVARIYLGIVDDFGGFFESIGVPFGFYAAWFVTVFEIAGSISLIAGRYIFPLSLLFALHLIFGILLVHSGEGWFVVGAGRNGMEYSVLLIVVFLALAINQSGNKPLELIDAAADDID